MYFSNLYIFSTLDGNGVYPGGAGCPGAAGGCPGGGGIPTPPSGAAPPPPFNYNIPQARPESPNDNVETKDDLNIRL